jgi:hypothetical protein
MPVDIWDYAKIQNRDSLQEIWNGFDLNNAYTASVDVEIIDAIAAISAEWKAAMDACETVDELEDVLAEAYKVTSELEVIIKSLDQYSTNPNNLIVIYNTWYADK